MYIIITQSETFWDRDLIQNAKLRENVQLPSRPFGAHFKRPGYLEENGRVEKMGSEMRESKYLDLDFLNSYI